MKYQQQNEWVFWHDGLHWIANNALVQVKGKELDDLDKLIIQWCKDHIKDCKAVWLYYDNQRIPAWMRPYMQHYMNRILKI